MRDVKAIPAFLPLCCAMALAACVPDAAPAPLPAPRAAGIAATKHEPPPPVTPNPELKELFSADQGDRRSQKRNVDGRAVHERDEARRTRVRQILDTGGAKLGIDYFLAAMVFQHGTSPEDYRVAHECAMKAVELDPSLNQAKWLAAASKDRELMSLGKPQRYGTQFRRKDRSAFWELYEVDPTVTDDERAEWNVPPLEEAKKRVDTLNGR